MTSALNTPSEGVEVPFSILDTDLYKLTMQNAVLKHFHDAYVTIRFTNRTSEMLFNRQCFDWIQERVIRLSSLKLQPSEREALAKTCPYFPSSYLDYLSSIQLKPEEQVKLRFVPKAGAEDPTLGEMGGIECSIEGYWRDTILYEVPILAIVSEAYFRFIDTDWTVDGVQDKARQKGYDLLKPSTEHSPVIYSEFGTRRRRSFYVQDLVMQGLIEGQAQAKKEAEKAGTECGILSGTSNVYLALKYGLKPMGTIAHEWIMAVGASFGYEHANSKAMDLWEEVYPREPNAPPLIMLTDTFTVRAFFIDFLSDPTRALRWDALRHDSGSPFEFVQLAKKAWAEVESGAGIKRDDERKVGEGKKCVFSDSLDTEAVRKIQQECDKAGIGATYGIGTFLTNDFQKASNGKQHSKPLNIVIKLNKINGKDCVKLSDDVGKYTGNVEEVKRVQAILGLGHEHEGKRRG